MPNNFEELCDDFDAAVFTGDHLEDVNNRQLLYAYLSSWRKHLESYDTDEEGQ